MVEPHAKVVALIGLSGSGKSVVARRLYEGLGFTRIRFGDAMRDMLHAGFGLTEEQIDRDGSVASHVRFGGAHPMFMLTSLSKWGRQIYGPMWDYEWKRRVARMEPGTFVLVDDVQRLSEIEMVRSVGGVIVNIHRPDYTCAARDQRLRHRNMTAAGLPHDIQITNDGPDALVERADEFARQIGAYRAEAA